MKPGKPVENIEPMIILRDPFPGCRQEAREPYGPGPEWSNQVLHME
jgi:hypothetical protein